MASTVKFHLSPSLRPGKVGCHIVWWVRIHDCLTQVGCFSSFFFLWSTHNCGSNVCSWLKQNVNCSCLVIHSQSISNNMYFIAQYVWSLGQCAIWLYSIFNTIDCDWILSQIKLNFYICWSTVKEVTLRSKPCTCYLKQVRISIVEMVQYLMLIRLLN